MSRGGGVQLTSVRTRWFVVLFVLAGLLAAGCGDGSDQADASASTQTTTNGRKFRLIAPAGLLHILRKERAKRQEQQTATATTKPPATGPFFVAQLHMTFVDPSRSSPARGGTPASSSRSLRTTIYYPASVQPSAAQPNPPPARGPFPLLVFAHGFAIDAASYSPLLVDLAEGGYVVAAPDFPGTSTALSGGAIRSDSLQEPADISFVITSMIQLSATQGLLFGTVNPNAVGDSGQSDGGVVAAATAYNTCCIDARIKASAILTGAAFGFEGQWFPPGTPPALFAHGDADEVNAYNASTSMFNRAQSPKYLYTIQGGTHLEPYVDPPWEEHVAATMLAFYDLYLKGDASASQRLTTLGNEPGYSLQSG